jgi:glycosyltransferase involved in cell wall biosynthesis
MSADSNQARREGVLLLGMHRSGTSIMARTLGAMGLWLGDEAQMLDAHPTDNPTGYWERSDIHDAHVQYLAASGHAWDRLAGFRVASIDGPDADTLIGQLTAVVSGLDQQRPWLVKDPRSSILLPFWQHVAPAHACVVAVRHPLEIAASLRNTPRGVYVTPFLLLLWQKYMSRMLSDLAGRQAIFVSYGALMANPAEQVERLRFLLADQRVDMGDVAVNTTQLFEPRLRRQRVDDETRLMPEQRDLYRWLVDAAALQRAVEVPSKAWHEPDVELAEFEANADFLILHGRNTAAGEVLHRLANLEAQNHAVLQQAIAHQDLLRNQVMVEQERVRALDAEQRRTERARERATTDLELALRRADEVERKAAQLDDELQQSRQMLQATAVHVRNMEQMFKDVTRSLSWRAGAPIRWLGGLASLRFPPGAERVLHRLYYRIPGLNARRKRAAVAWLHDRMPWLTRHTLSYQLHQASRQMASPAARDRWMEPLSPHARLERLNGLARRPLVSVIMPVFNTDPRWLEAAVESMFAQSYPDWELCIADDASTRQETRDALAALDDPRIRVVRLEANSGIAVASNAALDVARGEFVALLDHDDELAADALIEIVTAIDREDADFVYSDEDKIDFDGNHVDPHFKADYSPDYLFSINYLCHLAVMRRDLLQRIGGFRAGFDGAQDFDLFLRYLEHAKRIVHVPRVLYHWRMHEGSTAAASSAKPKSWDAGCRAVADALERRQIAARVEPGPYPNTYCVRRCLKDEPLISVIVPFKDKPELLEACLNSVIEKSGYQNFEFLAVDNGSQLAATHRLLESLPARDARVRVLAYDAPFNYSAINNWAVTQSRGDVLLFLNNDIEAISDGWMLAMLEHAQRGDVGVVGALLLYPDNTVQHSGVIVGLGGVAGHAHLHDKVESPGYFSRLHLIQDLSAVTFACAMTRRAVFDKVGGLNENELTIAFNDVDYCLRARELGLRVIYTPCARLYHFESKSRGYEDTPEKQARFGKEIAYMQRRHADVLTAGDPFYNPNFALDRPSFVVRSQ